MCALRNIVAPAAIFTITEGYFVLIGSLSFPLCAHTHPDPVIVTGFCDLYRIDVVFVQMIVLLMFCYHSVVCVASH